MGVVRPTGHVNCCGYTHLTMTSADDTESTYQSLIGAVQGMEENVKTHTNRVFEIILNDNQCKNMPKLLKLMAALGFVYVGRMNNGAHDSWINIFHRYQRNGREFVNPKFKWEGMSVMETIRDFQIEPVKFKKPEVPNPFAKGKGEYNTADIMKVLV